MAMKGKLRFAVALPATLIVGSLWAQEAGPVQRGLEKVRPDQGTADEEMPDRFERWRERLSVPDLDERQQHFEQVVQSARRNPGLRKALEAWARQSDELAWSARLALRELSRSTAWGFPSLQGFGHQGAALDWPWLERLDLDELRRRMEESFAPPQGARPLDGSRSFRSLRLQMGTDGVECEVTTDEDGQEVTQTFQARTVEELLEAHPELKDHIRSGGLRAGIGWPELLGSQPGGFDLLPLLGGLGAAPLRTDILGVVVQPLEEGQAASLELEHGLGLFVQRVEPGTIAATLGLRRGEVLVELNGRALKVRDDISAALAERGAQDEVRVELLDRWGRRCTRVWKPAPESLLPPLDSDGRQY
jgi:hypothetical protein